MDLSSSLVGIRNAVILMAIVLITETVVPLYRRSKDHTRHLLPNLSFALLTFALGVLLNIGLLAGLVFLGAAKLGLFGSDILSDP